VKQPHKIDDLRRESEASKNPEEHLPRHGVECLDKIDKKHPGILLKSICRETRMVKMASTVFLPGMNPHCASSPITCM
jgi:hypothetical protein